MPPNAKMNPQLNRRGWASPGVFCKAAAAITCSALLASCADHQDSGGVRVVHALQSPFASAEALDSSGKSLAKTSFDCAPGQTCQLTLPKDVLTQTTALRFRDGSGRLVGAYPRANLANTGYSITADAGMMGVELFSRLVAQGRYTPATLVHLADQHIYREVPAGARPSLFEDLQAHYQRALVDPAINEQKYIDAVLKAVDEYSNGKTAASTSSPSAAQPKARALAATTAGAVTQACPDGFTALNTMAGLTSLVTGALGTPFSLVVGTVSGMIGGVCNQATLVGALTQVMDQLNSIQATVDAMDAKLSSLGVRVDQIADQVAFNNVLTQYSAFNKDLRAVNTYVNTYKSLLQSNNTSATGYTTPAYADLSAYVSALPGGLNKDTLASYPALKDLLVDWNMAVDNYTSLVEATRALAIKTSLQDLCNTPANIAGDVLMRRTQCNVFSLQLIAQSAVSLSQLVIVLRDALTVIDAQFAGAANNKELLAWLSANLVNKKYPTLSWANTRQQVLSDLLTGLNTMTGHLRAAQIETTSGLPVELMGNMVLAGCDKSLSGQSVAAVESWIVKEATGLPASPSAYITTQCKGRNDELVYSRFHYTTDVGPNKEVLNMLGVLIKPNPQSSDWTPGGRTIAGYNIGGADLGYASYQVCVDRGGGRCDWWAVVPGVTTPATNSSVIPVPLTQVRAHTGPAISSTQRVAVNDAYFYNPPNNDRILFPVTTPMGYTQGYSTGPVQHLNGTAFTYGRGVLDAYISYTWVTDTANWQTKPDRKYTRTIVYRVGTTHEEDSDFKRFKTNLLTLCATSDCTVVDKTTLTLTFSGGPKIQWDYFFGEWGKMHMFVDGKSPDGRAYPNNAQLRS